MWKEVEPGEVPKGAWCKRSSADMSAKGQLASVRGAAQCLVGGGENQDLALAPPELCGHQDLGCTDTKKEVWWSAELSMEEAVQPCGA